MIESVRRQRGARNVRSMDEALHLESLMLLQDQASTFPLDLPTLLSLVATGAHQLTGAFGAMVEMFEQDSLVCRAATGSMSSLLGLKTGMDGSLSELAFRTDQMLVCDDACTDQRVDPALCESLNLRSMVVAPLRSRRTCFGVLVITSPCPGAFGNRHQQILRLVAGILASRLDLAEQLQARELLLTENAIALATLRESESRFSSAFDHSGIGMALMAIDGRWLKVNAALCRIIGYSRQEMLLRNHGSDTHPDDLQVDAPFVLQILAGEIVTYEVEKRYVHKQGSVVWGLLTISSIKSAGQHPLYLIAKIQDITARKEAEAALRRLADRDDLTGLYNRREMLRLLGQETSRSDRHHRPVSLIMLDVDGFKNVNDTYGHQAGDSALRRIARIIEGCVRSFDRVARYGGEEFAVILPDTAGLDALIVAERIRACVAAEDLEIGQESGPSVRITLTISAGITTMIGDHEKAVELLIREADARLYVAKNAGKNQCVPTASALVAPDTRSHEHAVT